MDDKGKGADAAALEENPTQILKHEHDATLLRLGLMRRSLQCLQGPRKNIPERIEVEKVLLKDLVDALERTMRPHFQKEEEGLFPILAEYIGKEHGPIEAMLHEHRKIRAIFSGLKENAQKAFGRKGPTDETMLKTVLESGFEAVGLLNEHIEKENQVLFKICEVSLSEEEKREVVRRMNAIGSGAVG